MIRGCQILIIIMNELIMQQGQNLQIITREIIMGKFIELFGEKTYLKSWQEKLAEIHEQHNKLGMPEHIMSLRKTPEEMAAIDAKHNARFKGAKDRLAYYRSHGLDNCSDYPGGDEAFERDVLSGEQREECMVFSFNMKSEDDYICKCLKNGRFVPEMNFVSIFKVHPKIYDICMHVFPVLYEVSITYHPFVDNDPWLPNASYYRKRAEN